ncbi:MAG: hypothetical protein DRP85_06455 [Candidatus Makaraimicrobium thalassicum]|nr:MAG: hypothetical protein DRP85_06455 [Candidatus Omnitrophota bacterium]
MDAVLQEAQVDPSALPDGEQVLDPSPDEVAQQEDLSPADLLEQEMDGVFEPPVKAEPEPVISSDPEQETQSEQLGQPALSAPAAQPEAWETAPTNWSMDEQEHFNALPADQKQFVHRTVTGASRAAQEKMDHAAEIRRTVEQFVDKINKPQPAEPQTQQHEEVVPDDPIERIKYETKQEIRQEDARVKEQERQAKTETLIRETVEVINKDPLRPQVQQLLDSKVEASANVVDMSDPQGRTYREIELTRLKTDPLYFRHVYEQARNMVVQRQAPRQQGLQSAPTQPTAQPAPTQPAQTKVRQTRTPVLERAGQSAPIPKADPRVAQKAKILRDISSGRVTSKTLGDFLDNAVADASFA